MNAPFASVEQAADRVSAQMLAPLAERREVRKAVILAAGRGRRMGKLTADRPKGAIEVGGHALIDWQIEALRAAGVREIAVVTGHGAAALAGRDVEYIHNANWAMGTQVETLLAAADWIGKEPVIVSYSDIIYHPCAPLALLERPGDIVVAYDADHRWLWKRRFGNWLKDSETFKLGPGQVLVEIGDKPIDIDDLDGQFMGLVLLTSAGLKELSQSFLAAGAIHRKKLDFTSLLGLLVGAGVRIDTAANLLPWTEIDSLNDLKIARSMAERDERRGRGAELIYPPELLSEFYDESSDTPNLPGCQRDLIIPSDNTISRSNAGTNASIDFSEAISYEVDNIIAIQNWGRSGSTFLQSLFDDHGQILSTPNFYSRHFYSAWAGVIGRVPITETIDTFLQAFRQWWDSGFVDATAGLHRLGTAQNDVAVVDRMALEGYLRAALQNRGSITRRKLFELVHVAYALARGQDLQCKNLKILFPVHGEPRAVAAAILEDFPSACFINTVRDPNENIKSVERYYVFHKLNFRIDPLEKSVSSLFRRYGIRAGRPITLFGDRAYFDWMVTEDQIRIVRLEDLRVERGHVMAALAEWLNISYSSQLLLSTWNGLRWGDRPDSTRLSIPAKQSAEHVGGTADERARMSLLLRGVPSVAAAYGEHHSPAKIPPLRILFRAFFSRFTRSHPVWAGDLYALQGLLLIQRILPLNINRLLLENLARARMESQLVEHAAGATYVRRKLPDQRKPGVIRATLLLKAYGNKWKMSASVAVDIKDRCSSDEIDVIFIGTNHGHRFIDHAFWMLARSIGGAISGTKSFINIRRSLVNFAFRRHQYRNAIVKNILSG